MIPATKKLIIIPSLAIWLIDIFSEPYTIAFGAVATGNIKAQEALMVAGIINIEAFDILSDA